MSNFLLMVKTVEGRTAGGETATPCEYDFGDGILFHRNPKIQSKQCVILRLIHIMSCRFV